LNSKLVKSAAGAGAALLWALGPAGPASAAPERGAPPIFVNGAAIGGRAILEHGHLLVPVRGVFEALHAEVAYVPPRIVVVRANGSVLAGLVIDRRHAIVNDRPRDLPAAPIRRAGRIYVPLRFIAEIVGATATYSPTPWRVDVRALAAAPVAVEGAEAGADSGAPRDDTPPTWAIVLVGLLVLTTFAAECVRRIALARVAKRARIPR
jgi:hypothetical protein